VGTCHAMGGHGSLLMVIVWVWVQIRRKMLGSVEDPYDLTYLREDWWGPEAIQRWPV
jgi:hypothetical protein